MSRPRRIHHASAAMVSFTHGLGTVELRTGVVQRCAACDGEGAVR